MSLEFKACAVDQTRTTVAAGREAHVHDACMHIVGRDGDVALNFEHAFDCDGRRFFGGFITFEPENGIKVNVRAM